MKRSQVVALSRLLGELDIVRAWFDDTGYPKQSRERFEELVRTVESEFATQLALAPIALEPPEA